MPGSAARGRADGCRVSALGEPAAVSQDDAAALSGEIAPVARFAGSGNAGEDVRVKVIAGESLGKHAAIDAYADHVSVHFTLQPGAATVEQPIPPLTTLFAYVIDAAACGGFPCESCRRGANWRWCARHGAESVRLAKPSGREGRSTCC